MGRIKTKLVKRYAALLIRDHKEELKKDFDDNKKIVEKFLELNSKKLRNVLAGAVTKAMRHTEDLN